jgi:hypothetical protein
MTTVHLKNNIPLFCITADSFPDGVPHAWHHLHRLLEDTTGRTFYGISYKNEHGAIVYKAGVAEAAAGEGDRYGCEPFVIPCGQYLSETVTDFSKQLHQIGNTFQTLLAHQACATDTVCVEWYCNDRDVVCLVKQAESGLRH